MATAVALSRSLLGSSVSVHDAGGNTQKPCAVHTSRTSVPPGGPATWHSVSVLHCASSHVLAATKHAPPVGLNPLVHCASVVHSGLSGTHTAACASQWMPVPQPSASSTSSMPSKSVSPC